MPSYVLQTRANGGFLAQRNESRFAAILPPLGKRDLGSATHGDLSADFNAVRADDGFRVSSSSSSSHAL